MLKCFQSKAINENNLTPGFKLRVCNNKADVQSDDKLRVDGSFYRDGIPDAPVPEDGRPHWDSQILPVEFKKDDQNKDPFSDSGDPCPEATSHRDTRAQIITYAELIMGIQHRVAVFMLVVVGPKCRITRWDRSGVAFTVSIDYVDEWQRFCRFLWRMSRCSDEQLGLDPTAERIYPSHPYYRLMDDVGMAQDTDLDHLPHEVSKNEFDPDKVSLGEPLFRYVRDMFRDSLVAGYPRYRLAVPMDSEIRYFLVAKPKFSAKGMSGRGTRGFVAFDPKTGRFVWLKDWWRMCYTLVEAEGDILAQLNAAGIVNIPTLLCHGDMDGQRTETPAIWRWAQSQRSSNPEFDCALRNSDYPIPVIPKGAAIMTTFLADPPRLARGQKRKWDESTMSGEPSAGSVGGECELTRQSSALPSLLTRNVLRYARDSPKGNNSAQCINFTLAHSPHPLGAALKLCMMSNLFTAHPGCLPFALGPVNSVFRATYIS